MRYIFSLVLFSSAALAVFAYILEIKIRNK